MKLPPFGKPLKALLDEGKFPNNAVYLYTGNNAWRSGSNTVISRPNRTLILPPNESPFDYDWPVNGCDILLIETSKQSKDYRETLAMVLLSAGANKIVCITKDLPSPIYKKEF
jgi:hypothetical protein